MSQSPSQFDVSSVNGAQQYDCWRQHSSSLVWVRSVACLGFCRFHQCEKPGSRSIWSCILLPTLALYIRGTSETIARILQPYNILVAHKPITALLRLLNNVKDEDKPEDRQGAVYKIKCCDCQASYIGETGRNLSTRLTEHKRATRNGGVRNYINSVHKGEGHSFFLFLLFFLFLITVITVNFNKYTCKSLMKLEIFFFFFQLLVFMLPFP